MMSHEKAVVERKDQNCIEYILYYIIQLGEKPGEITINMWQCKHEIKNRQWIKKYHQIDVDTFKQLVELM